MGRQVTAATEIMDHLDQVMARDAECPGHFVHRHPCRFAQGSLHQHPDRVIGISTQSHSPAKMAASGKQFKLNMYLHYSFSETMVFQL